VKQRQRQHVQAARKIRMPAVLGALGFFFTALPAHAQSAEFVSGEVTKIDEAAGKISIKHGPLKKFGMETGMTMVFQVPDPRIIQGLKPGDKIKFVPDRVDDRFTTAKIQKEK
jgi:Cu/Ag efflux protein CusF